MFSCASSAHSARKTASLHSPATVAARSRANVADTLRIILVSAPLESAETSAISQIATKHPPMDLPLYTEHSCGSVAIQTQGEIIDRMVVAILGEEADANQVLLWGEGVCRAARYAPFLS